MSRPLTLEEFIRKSNTIHSNKYDYSLSKYINSKTKMEIICQKHGIFQQIPNSHLLGAGCNLCGKESARLLRLHSNDNFIEIAKSIHGYKYDYSLVQYQNKKEKIKIICPIHGMFIQQVSSHLKGYGCRKCGYLQTGWNRTKFSEAAKRNGNAILYIAELYSDTEKFLKIGITTVSVKGRLRRIPYKSKIIFSIDVKSGGTVFDLEKYLHNTFKNYQYTPKVMFCGDGECFSGLELVDIKNKIFNFVPDNGH